MSLLHNHYNASSLVRLLQNCSPTATATPPQHNTTERLARWLSVADAMRLHSVQQQLHTLTAMPAGAAMRPTDDDSTSAPAPSEALTYALHAMQTALVASWSARSDRAQRPVPRHSYADHQPHDRLDFTLHQQYYLEQQRQMDTSIQALRSQIRLALASTSPHLAQLAALDTVLHKMLEDRTKSALARIPTLLKTRFEQLRDAHGDSPHASTPTGLPLPAWLLEFEQFLQTTLRAELDLRLQPLMGLIEAHHHHADSGKHR